jgi:hypothetical protein
MLHRKGIRATGWMNHTKTPALANVSSRKMGKARIVGLCLVALFSVLFPMQRTTGDHPVVVLLINDNQIWEPVSRPVQGITNLADILQHPKYAFMVAFSPHICASVVRGEPGEVHLPPKTVDLKDVREFNNLIRNQCKIFTLARDRGSLE